MLTRGNHQRGTLLPLSRVATRAPHAADRLQHELANALDAAGAPWRVRVVANAARRIAAWLGAAALCSVPSLVSVEESCPPLRSNTSSTLAVLAAKRVAVFPLKIL